MSRSRCPRTPTGILLGARGALLTAFLLPAFVFAQPCPLAQLTDTTSGVTDWADLNRSAFRVVFHSTGDPLPGGNPDGSFELYLHDAETGALRQITDDPSGWSLNPKISAHGTRVAFLSNADHVPGGNADGGFEVFRYDVFTDRITQITAGVGGTVADVSTDGTGSRIVFRSNRDLVPGNNLDGNDEIFLWDDGTFLQLTDAAAGASRRPRISWDGSRVVFESTADLVAGGNADGNREIFLLDLPSGALTQVTVSTGSKFGIANANPALDAEGSLVVFESTRDLVPGGNPDGSREVFLFRAILQEDADMETPGKLSMITQSPTLSSGLPDIDGEGRRIVFVRANQIHLYDRMSGTTNQLTFSGFNSLPSIEEDQIAFRSSANPLGTNPDLSSEIFVADCSGLF